MSETQENRTGHKIADLIPQQTKATIIQIYKPKKKKEFIPYLIRNIENEFEFNLFDKNTYQKFKTNKLIRIWNQLKQIKVKGKKSILFEEAKNVFLNHLKKISVSETYNEEIFVNKYYYIATLEIKQKSLITLWKKDDSELIRTTEPRECSAWTEEDVRNHLVKNFKQSRL